MKHSVSTTIASSVFFLGCSWSSAPSALELSENVELHGYGHVGYLKTDTNRYLKADSNGTDDYNDIALLLTAKINEQSKAWVQVFSIYGKARLDWAFVDYQFTDGPTLHLGQIKLPIGLANEVRDIEFLRPSSVRPFLYHKASEISDEAFRGLNLIYSHELGNGSLTWNAYSGRAVEFEASDHHHYAITGGRVIYQTPIDGLRAVASTYSNNLQEVATGETTRKKAWVLSLDYAHDDLDLKTEYGRVSAFGGIAESWYAQAAYTIQEHWKPFVRYDYFTPDRAKRNDPSFYQRAKVVGLGYAINNNLGLRLETHFNHGYALPVATGEIDAGAGDVDWRMTAFSVNFVF